MPKSRRCGTCNTPVRGHARRKTTGATRLVRKLQSIFRKGRNPNERPVND